MSEQSNPLLKSNSQQQRKSKGAAATAARRHRRRRSASDYDIDVAAAMRTPFTSKRKKSMIYLTILPVIMFGWMAFQLVDAGLVGEKTTNMLMFVTSLWAASLYTLWTTDAEDWYNEDNYVVVGKEDQDDD